MSKYNKYTKEEIQQIIEFYKDHSLKETGNQFNISSGLVKRILIENNQPLRNKSESSKLGLVKYKKTSLDKYGVEFPAQSEEVKEKYSIVDKAKKSILPMLELKETVLSEEKKALFIPVFDLQNDLFEITKILFEVNKNVQIYFRCEDVTIWPQAYFIVVVQ